MQPAGIPEQPEAKDKHRIRITDLLKSHPEGLTIADVMKHTGLSRHTVLARLHHLVGSGKVTVRTINMAKVHYWNEPAAPAALTVPAPEREREREREKKPKKKSKGKKKMNRKRKEDRKKQKNKNRPHCPLLSSRSPVNTSNAILTSR